MLSLSATSLLFFYRVRAVYGNSIIITGVFGFLWMASSGLSVLIPLSIEGGVSCILLINVKPRSSFDALPPFFSSHLSST
jgi:hypothetical protein